MPSFHRLHHDPVMVIMIQRSPVIPFGLMLKHADGEAIPAQPSCAKMNPFVSIALSFSSIVGSRMPETSLTLSGVQLDAPASASQRPDFHH